ncbi:unnamed protein product [Choristocarpus tenellus]
MLPSRSGAQQGDPLGPLQYCMGTSKALQWVQFTFEPQGVSSRSYLDDTSISAREISPDTIAVFEQLKTDLHEVGIALNMDKTSAAPPQGHQPIPSILELLTTVGFSLVLNSNGFVTCGNR